MNNSCNEINELQKILICCSNHKKKIFIEILTSFNFSAGSKLRRFKSAIDANIISPPFPPEYQDVHVIAGVLKSYLRDLPEPLLTYYLYDEFVSGAQLPSEDGRRKAILSAVKKLPKSNYQNVRYLSKFLSILAQNEPTNKMTSQNIAIVMSPNLLWPPNSVDTDYVAKVSSSAAVNVIVDLFINEWSVFFDEDDIDFYVTLNREDLFPDSGGFTRESTINTDIMTKSMHAIGATSISTQIEANTYQTHSRSSSHDTSLILYGNSGLDGATGGGHGHIKRSQSSSSMSDTSSPPQQNSPKLPVRRKHNKQAAPTPPETKYPTAMARSGQFTEQSFNRLVKYHQDQDDETLSSLQHYQNQQQQSQQMPQKPPLAARRFFDSNDNLSKPDKPPRPVLVSTECQTLNRSQYRSAKETDRANKPAIQPKSMLFTNRSTENLTDKSDDQEPYYDEVEITYRNKSDKNSIVVAASSDRPAKPAIPERPITLMRPPSFKSGSVPDNSHPYQNFSSHIDQSTSTSNQPIKKTQSFRGNTISKGVNGGSNNGSLSANGGSLTTLERTHIYNVDKKQVAIIDFVDTSCSKTTTTNEPVPSSRTILPTTSTSSSTDDKVVPSPLVLPSVTTVPIDTTSNSQSTTAPGTITPISLGTQQIMPAPMTISTVPPSPRGFDPKIKRPQIPAPPPPTSHRPKSDGGADSTNL